MMDYKNNILTIDDKSASVSYHKSDISNTANYKVSLTELMEIFKENHKDIYDCDTCECFTAIMHNGDELNLRDLEKLKVTQGYANPVFYKIATTELTLAGCEIIISAQHPANDISSMPITEHKAIDNFSVPVSVKSWNEAEKEAMKDIDGYTNTMRLYEKLETESMNAIRYCAKSQKKIGDFIYKGFIPSIKQMDIIYKCTDIINYVSGSFMTVTFYGTYATSTVLEQDNEYFWALMNNIGRTEFGVTHRNNYTNTFPIYKRFVNNENDSNENE